MKIDFYHIDAFEVANYEAIWRELRAMGVDAKLVAVHDSRNTAQAGWFDFERFSGYCQARGLEFSTEVTPDANLGVTTQNADILRDYATRVRLMYCPTPYTTGWSMSQRAVQPFDHILVHGPFFVEKFQQYLKPEQLHAIGYPRYDDFFAGRLDRRAIRARWGIHDERPVLAFLPTWLDNTAFDSFFPALLTLRDRYHIVLRPHHCTIRMEPQRMALMHASGLTILTDAYELVDVYVGADQVVSDVRSGSLFEACMCNLPTVGMVPDPAEVHGWLADNQVGAVTRLCVDPAELAQAVEESKDAHFEQGRQRWAERHVSFRDGSAARRSAEKLIELATPRAVQVVAPRSYRVKVSVVLPTYNHAAFLPQAVEAILKQSFTDFELIIVNDGSTDDSASYLATLTDPRVTVIERANGGLPSALNCGFAASGGEYRTWTSADNVTGPSWLERLVSKLDQAGPNVGFACSGFAIMDQEQRLLHIRKGQQLALDSLISANPGIASFLYRSSVAEQVGEYDTALVGAEDWDMWLRIMEVCDPVYVDDLLYYYRVHGNSMTSSIPHKVADASRAATAKLLARHGGNFNLDRIYPGLRSSADPALARWQARARLAASLVDSPFWAPEVKAGLLIETLRERFSPEVHSNLLRLLCLHGGWALALQSLEEISTRHPSPLLDQLRPLLASQDSAALALLPLQRTPEAQLAFRLGRA